MDLTVAKTILHQLGGQRRLILMTGAHAFAAEENSVRFSFKMCERANKCMIILEPGDTYRFQLWKCNPRTGENDLVVDLDDVYFDMLIPLFEEETGLNLTFVERRQ